MFDRYERLQEKQKRQRQLAEEENNQISDVHVSQNLGLTKWYMQQICIYSEDSTPEINPSHQSEIKILERVFELEEDVRKANKKVSNRVFWHKPIFIT